MNWTPVLQSCAISTPWCDDTSGVDLGVPLATVVAVMALVATTILVRRGRVGWAFVPGVAATALGVALALTMAPVAAFGWFAYTPLSGTTFVPLGVGSVHISVLLLAGTGLLSIGCALGAMLVRSRREPRRN